MADVTRKADQAPGVMAIRLLGDPADLDALAGLLSGLPGVELLSRSAGRPNRYEPGERVYLTVQLARQGSDQRPDADYAGPEGRERIRKQAEVRPSDWCGAARNGYAYSCRLRRGHDGDDHQFVSPVSGVVSTWPVRIARRGGERP